ncbi:HD domain-containing phosphohydrolase [Arcobacter sp. YIC-310]|uniref:HD domain-containing phosphohydrolase n=1 Tax=Arcobacter sp. YIC-310 TaxID=3376632 RepID=UPI003C2766B3
MLRFFQKLTKDFSIKKIVIGGVIVMAIVITIFAFTMVYLSSTIKYDQTTLKNILELERQNQKVLTLIKSINYLENRIILVDNQKSLKGYEELLLNINDDFLIKKDEDYLFEYNEELKKVSKNINTLVLFQKKTFDSKNVILFFKNEIKQYKLKIDESIKNISNETEALYGKASLYDKRYIRRNKENLDFNIIRKYQKIMTLSKELDSSILKLPTFLSYINNTDNIDILRSIKRNNLNQLISLFESTLNRINSINDKRFNKNLININNEFYKVRDLINLFVISKQRHLIEEKAFESLIKESEIVNLDVISQISKLNKISNEIKTNILNHSDSISKSTTVIIIIVSIASLFLLVLSAATLISRINFPLEFIIKYIEKIINHKKDLSSKLPIFTNDEFGKLSISFNSMTSTIDENIHEIESLNNEIESTQKEVVFTMGAIGESRSKETGNHVRRVAEYSKLLALKYGLDKNIAELLKEASPMHDIGKVGIPDAILKKPAKLDKEEWEIMKTHAQLGYDMLKHSQREILKAAAIVAHEHHEKWDGSGYPRGLKGTEIHIYGRITAVADVFDALGSDRCYKKAWKIEDIKKFFIENKGSHFEPKLVDLLFEYFDEFLAIRDRYKDDF